MLFGAGDVLGDCDRGWQGRPGDPPGIHGLWAVLKSSAAYTTSFTVHRLLGG